MTLHISDGYQTIEYYLQEEEKKLGWARNLLAHQKPLDAICDIVQLGKLWNSTRDHLLLDYVGKAENEEEAREDLSRIMSALKVIFEDLKIHQWSDARYPTGLYVGEGRLGRLKIPIELEVRWLPAYCRLTFSKRVVRSTRWIPLAS